MTHLIFLTECLIPHWDLYLLSLVIVLLIYIPIFKRFTNSILDPAFYALISTIFANTIPLFLVIINAISTETFIYFIFSESLFWIGYFLVYVKNVKFNNYNYDDSNFSNSLFTLLLIALVICQLITYLKQGIPIFSKDRLSTYSSGGGIGILSYVINIATIYCCIYSFYLIGKQKHKLKGYFTLLIIVFFSLLSGSKSAILILVFCYYFYKYYYIKKNINYGKFKRYILLIILFPLCSIIISKNSDFVTALTSLINRVIANGDGYWQAYPNNTMSEVVINKPWIYLLSRILCPFRIINYDEVETVIGIQLNAIIYPNSEEVIGGSNTRLPVLSWILFGWKGLILSFIMGTITALWKTKLPSILPNGIIPVIFYAFIYISFISVITDPLFSTGRFFDLAIFMTLFVIGILLLRKGRIILKRIN